MDIRRYRLHRACATHRYFILLGLLTWAAATAGPAVFDVKLAAGNPPRLIVKIDTNPWAAGAAAPTANLTVTFTTPDKRRVNKTYDFLENAHGTTYLEQGHVYQRTLPTGVASGSSIQSAQLEFPNRDGKTDAPSASKGPAGAATVVVPGPSIMTFEPHVNRNLRDYTSTAVKSAQDCSNLCLGAAQCASFTLVKEGTSQYGTCWLKSTVPPPEPCDNCTSGVKKTQ